MAKPTRGHVKGAQQHAEGQQGPKTHRMQQALNATGRDKPDPTRPSGPPTREGKHRLTEDRQQHDLAEKISELDKLPNQ